MRRLLPLLVLAACQSSTTLTSFDILIINGTVYDGSQHEGRFGNIGIRNGQILSVDAEATADARTIIDAHGKLVTPGFIDPHTHARDTLQNPTTNANLNYLTQGVTTVFIGNDGDGVPERESTLKHFESQGIGSNVAFFAGHGSIREATMGRADRLATPAELSDMQARLNAEMAAGALGISSGLFYVPGSYADTEELVALSKTAAQFGGVYDTHMRSESSHGDGVLAAVEETIRIAQAANIPVHISHIKALGADVHGRSADIVSVIAAARAEGLKVTANQYPWRASGTRFSNALIPGWVKADSEERMFIRLSDAELLPLIREEMQTNLRLRGGPGAMLVTEANSPYRGQTLSDIAATLHTDVLDAAIQVVVAGDPSIASFVMDQKDIDRLAVQPWTMTGSDGSSGHPRLYGTFPKAWTDFVVGSKMSVADFVYRSSGLVADSFGLCDRGYVRAGRIADIAVINPEQYRAHADYESPTAQSEGIEYLVVNGVIVIENGHYTGKLPGKVIRRPSCND